MSSNIFPLHFVNAGSDYSTLNHYVSAPYFRRGFEVSDNIKCAKMQICGLGFYELHINGVDITKGYLAPYRSNHDHYVYVDEYDVTSHIKKGKNVIASLLGNGMQNPLGAYIWDFDKARWRSSPQVSFELHLEYEDGEVQVVCSDEETKTAPSPILFDDLHYGEYYDARKELSGWDTVDYDDANWDNAKSVSAPYGKPRIGEMEPLVLQKELVPVSITPYAGGFIYDFGENTSGVCRLNIADSEEGQKILLQHFEVLNDGKPHLDGIRFNYDGFIDRFQEDEYYCKGAAVESYMPHFTYHGFRYVYVTGVTPKQAVPSLLTYKVIYSDIKSVGRFYCSDKMANMIQDAVVRSDCSNFHYFPTDCPQREKNGWTADVALSTEQMLLNLTAEKSYREWMRNVYKAINEKGQLPGIVPTTGWGYEWGNGPAWDNVLVYVPYYTYKYRGDIQILGECAEPLMRYLIYLSSRLREDDLAEFGLGDWCQAKRVGPDFDTPLIVTDTILAIDICRKAEFIYEVLAMENDLKYAKQLGDRMQSAFRKHLIEKDTLIVKGNTQTAQAMALYYGMFTPEESETAFTHLLKLIRVEDNHIATGVLGGKVIFRVLAEHGQADLAYHMITRADFPSYGNWMLRDSTTLWEHFLPEGAKVYSRNHHFWGDVSAWFYLYPGGIRFNPNGKDIERIDIEPCFLKELSDVSAEHQSPMGTVAVVWKRIENGIRLSITVPKCAYGRIKLPEGYQFEDGKLEHKVETGIYKIISNKT